MTHVFCQPLGFDSLGLCRELRHPASNVELRDSDPMDLAARRLAAMFGMF